MSKIITCRKPPVSGLICEKVLCIGFFDGNLECHEYVWNERLSSFATTGANIEKITYQQMESLYEQFMWESV